MPGLQNRVGFSGRAFYFGIFRLLLGKGLLLGGVGWRGGGKQCKTFAIYISGGFCWGGAEGGGPVTPAFPGSCTAMYRPVCKSEEVRASLSPSLAYFFRVGLLRGFVVCVCGGGCISESLFFCPHGCFGLRGAVAGSRGRARSGLRWHSRAVAINRNLLTRITTAGHGALGPLMQLLRATDSATAEPHGAATLDAKSSGAAFYFDFSAELLNRNALKQRGGGGGNNNNKKIRKKALLLIRLILSLKIAQWQDRDGTPETLEMVQICWRDGFPVVKKQYVIPRERAQLGAV